MEQKLAADRKVTATGLIVAAGRGERMGNEVPKAMLKVAGQPLLAYTLRVFEKAAAINQVVLVAPEEYLHAVVEGVVDALGMHKVQKVVAGGSSRQESVLAGLKAVDPGCRLVAIHDGARPLITADLIDQVVRAAARHGAAALAVRPNDTIRRGSKNVFQATMDREKLWLMQTPQVFSYRLILSAHQRALDVEYRGTDDVSLVEAIGKTTHVVEGRYDNIKVTTPEDLLFVEALLARRESR